MTRDLRVSQLRLEVHPKIPAWEVVVMMLVAALVGVMMGTGGVL